MAAIKHGRVNGFQRSCAQLAGRALVLLSPISANGAQWNGCARSAGRSLPARSMIPSCAARSAPPNPAFLAGCEPAQRVGDQERRGLVADRPVGHQHRPGAGEEERPRQTRQAFAAAADTRAAGVAGGQDHGVGVEIQADDVARRQHRARRIARVRRRGSDDGRLVLAAQLGRQQRMGGEVQDAVVLQRHVPHRFRGERGVEQLVRRRRVQAGRVPHPVRAVRTAEVGSEARLARAAGAGRAGKARLGLCKGHRTEAAETEPRVRRPRAARLAQRDEVGGRRHVRNRHLADQPRRVGEVIGLCRAGQQQPRTAATAAPRTARPPAPSRRRAALPPARASRRTAPAPLPCRTSAASRRAIRCSPAPA